jgi:RimJ/RimL family protein N-acetyltransferase
VGAGEGLGPPFPPPERRAGEGFVLRCWMPGDGALLQPAHVESYEHLRTYMPWAKADITVVECEKWARSCRARWLLGEDFCLIVLDATETRMLGSTGFHLRGAPASGRRAEVGLWIRADQAHQGLGTAVARAMFDWGFEAWGWRRLTWHCSDRNVGSRRVAEKIGLTLEATLREDGEDPEDVLRSTHIFGALAQEWVSR